MKYSLVSALLVAVSLTASAQDNEVNLGSDSTESVYWLLTDTVEREGHTIYGWIRSDDSKNTTVDFRSSKFKVKANCSTRRLAQMSSVTYAPNGVVMNNFHTDYPQSRPVVPGSMGEHFLDYLCKNHRSDPSKSDKMWDDLVN